MIEPTATPTSHNQHRDAIGSRQLSPNDFARSLFSSYAEMKPWADGSSTIWNLARYAPTGWAVNLAIDTAAALSKGTDNRYTQRDRGGDLLEGAEVVAQWVLRLANVQHEHLGSPWQPEALRKADRDLIDGMLPALVDVIARHWLPGMLNIGCRLAPTNDFDFDAAMHDSMNRALRLIDHARAIYVGRGGIEGETKTWRSGKGALDVALVAVIHAFQWGCAMAQHIIDSPDRGSALVKANAVKAYALIDAAKLEAVTVTLRDTVGAIIGSGAGGDRLNLGLFLQGLGADPNITAAFWGVPNGQK